MILIGDKLVPFENISKIEDIKDIKETKANSTVLFNYDDDILKYCFENEISNCIVVSNIKQAIYANSLNAKYIVCNTDLAIKVQKIADNYMFDSRILAIIESSNEIEAIALNEIDGAIYKTLL